MANFCKSVFVFCVAFYVVCAKHEVYDGHTLYEVFVKNEDQAKFVNGLETKIPVDFFVYAHTSRNGQVLVSKEQRKGFEDLLTSGDVEYKVLAENIREQLEMEERILAQHKDDKSNRFALGVEALSYNHIHRYEVVDDYLVRLGNAFPELVTVVSAGQSFEGRDVKYLKISTTNFEDRRKPVVFVMSLLHARDWVGLPGTLYTIDQLVLNVTESDLVNDIDWIILPIANPDGFEFTHTDFRFWRKNRRTGLTPDNSCLGVDLNRNFDIFWGTASSNNVCSDVFHGPEPFSEPETQNIRGIFEAYSDRIELFIDLHAHGSMILFGFGNGQLAPNALTLNLVGVNMAQAIDRVKWNAKPDYSVGNIYYATTAASGVASDFAHALGIPLSYTFDLPAIRGISAGNLGYLVELAFIRQAGYETWEGIKVGARIVRDFLNR
ncbi:carboxypeptidase B-like [Ostrinia nubilalis]|uniref:carboxypeptidase B-like n=1 Tax=Ostrinia nubilalis TaxID=29057 RepID=UPI00308245F2